jgi:glycosyltransferase involved in cell wall biosynthesis
MAPRVSVLIAAYNAESTIGETLASLVSQTFADWEAIVADDSSTDATAALAGDFDSRVRVITSDRNRGHAAPMRNLAAAEARGELIAFLDGDDRWLEDYLATLVGAYDEARGAGRDVGVVACDAWLSTPGTAGTYLDRIGRAGARVSLDALLRGNWLYASALIRRSVFDEVGGLAEDLKGTDDYDLWIRIAETGREVVIIDEPLAVYRIHDLQLSADEGSMSRATARVYARALRRGNLSATQRVVALRRFGLYRVLGMAPWLTRLSRRSVRRLRS